MKEETKSNNKKLIIIIIVLILIVLGLVGFIAVSSLKNEKVEPSENEKTKNNKDDEELDETELIDESIKKDLKMKIHYLTNEDESGRTNSYIFRYGKDNVMGNFFEKLDNDLKVYIVLDYLYKENKFQELATENESDPLVADTVKIKGKQEVKQISGDEVKKAYNDFFGTEDVTLVSPSISRSCFYYDYEPNKNIFYKVAPACGGTSASEIYSYHSKYSKNGEEIYVYVSYGFVKPASDSNSSSYIIYKDLDQNTEYKSVNSYDEVVSFKISEDNYSEFSEYKYTFQKNKDGSYYFKSLEKVK